MLTYSVGFLMTCAMGVLCKWLSAQFAAVRAFSIVHKYVLMQVSYLSKAFPTQYTPVRFLLGVTSVVWVYRRSFSTDIVIYTFSMKRYSAKLQSEYYIVVIGIGHPETENGKIF